MSDALIDSSEFYSPVGTSSLPLPPSAAPFDTSPLHNPAPLNDTVLVTQSPASHPAPTGSPHATVRGGGSLAIATDEMLTNAQNLHTIREQSTSLVSELHDVEVSLEPQNYNPASMVAVALQDAENSLMRARVQLTRAAASAGEIADAMDAAALAYGENERRMTAEFVNAQSLLATMMTILLTAGNPLLPGGLLFLLWFFGEKIRSALGGAIEPKESEIPAAINVLISDPEFVEVVRLSIMSLDDVLSIFFHLPGQLAGRDMPATAAILMVALQYAGLFSDSPVKVEKTRTVRGADPASTFVEIGDGIPSAVDGEPAQVRIDVISEDGRPDRFEVFIGGTADFSPLAGMEAFDMTSNVAMMAGLPAGALAGVERAMKDAGITADSEVVFSGHSQGALIAQKLVVSGDYNTAALVTFGSPGGGIVINAETPAILFENDDDIIPALGGTQRNDEAVVFRGEAFDNLSDIPADVALPAHRIEAYSALAQIADNDAGSHAVALVRDVVGDFAAGDITVTSHYYQITRDQN